MSDRWRAVEHHNLIMVGDNVADANHGSANKGQASTTISRDLSWYSASDLSPNFDLRYVAYDEAGAR
jgi:hypothetical protein